MENLIGLDSAFLTRRSGRLECIPFRWTTSTLASMRRSDLDGAFYIDLSEYRPQSRVLSTWCISMRGGAEKMISTLA